MASSSEGSRKESQPPWSQLKPDLLKIIAKKAIGNISDHIRFRSVCRAWRSVADPHLVKLAPLLMLCYNPSIDDRVFYSLSSNSVLTVSLPETRGKLILTSSHGWLVMLDHAIAQLSLFNPVTRAQIPLPPTTDLPHSSSGFFSPKSAFLSSEPDSANDDCVVIIEESGIRDVIFCRLGDKGWTVFHTDLAEFPRSILYRQGRFYVMDDTEIFYIYKANFDPRRRPELIYKIKAPFSGDLGFLEKTTGSELFLFVDDDKYYFLLNSYYYRLDTSKEPPEWSAVDNIGDRALFWTAEPSVSLYSWDFSECRANCIYYSTHYEWDWDPCKEPIVHKIQVFDTVTGYLDWLFCGEEQSYRLRPAMWFTPRLKKMEDVISAV